MDIEAHKATLESYARSHMTGNPSRDRFINLKIVHSLNVHQCAQRIMEGEQFDTRSTRIGNLAALYHDIGRFPQFSRYGTFNDRESVNHGRMGVLTLREMELPGDLRPEDIQIVRLAIGQHNLKTVRKDLREPYASPVKLVRDADKVDIFRVMIEHFSGENPDPVVTHGFDDIADQYTDSIYESVMKDEAGDYANIRYANDFKLLLIGWLPSLNYQTSIQLISELGYADKLLSFLPQDERIDALREKVDTFMRYNSHSAS